MSIAAEDMIIVQAIREEAKTLKAGQYEKMILEELNNERASLARIIGLARRLIDRVDRLSKDDGNLF